MKPVEKFIGIYPISRTLCFELKPEPKTKKIFDEWLLGVENDEQNVYNMFLKDKKIAEAYVALKPVLDKLHELYIDISLSSEKAKKIDFSSYFEDYKDKSLNADTEKNLRESIGETFLQGDAYFKNKFSDLKTGKGNGSCLMTNTILSYISNNLEEFCSEELSREELKEHIECFKGFYTYFQGYNTNRKNYYECRTEKSTAVATRIVHDNLPKFCDNILRFERRKEEYLSIYEYLSEKERCLQIKNESNGQFETAVPIDENCFKICHFNECLSQSQIEAYNKVIGNCNLLINLYNQSKKKEEKTFRKLDEFVTLYKQIGCGKRKGLYSAILKDKDEELSEDMRKRGEVLSVESLLKVVKSAGETYFRINEDTPVTVPYFIHFLKSCENWGGIYWSKSAVNTISSKYFSNWHDIKDRLKDKKSCATYDEKREEQIQLRDAIELSELFDVLDKFEAEYAFKKHLVEEGKIDIGKSISRNIILLLCAEIDSYIQEFLKNSEKIIQLESYRQKECINDEDDSIILQIKDWFDNTINIMRIVRYFSVPTGKMKGQIANPEMEKMLSYLLHNDDADWFGWYDLIRNYLTKKPQDDVKNRKLKLNFGKSTLLNGFTDSVTEKSDNGTQYCGYMFRKKHKCTGEYEYFLGISEKTKLFRCKNKHNIEDSDKSEFERLDYYQMKSTTPYPNEYGQKKVLIQNIVRELTKPGSEQEEKEWEIINNVGNNNGITPTELFKRLSDSQHFKHILEDKRLIDEVNAIIKLILDNCKKYIKIEAINKLQNKSYTGCDGLSKLLEDLKEITSTVKLFDFFHVSEKEFNEHNGNDLFLFKISNKDLSYSESYSNKLRKKKENQKENLHTLFFRALMHEDGFGDIVDLGKGEIFFREKAFSYDEKTWKVGHHAEELKSKFSYPIISKKRFAENKYLLHLSVTLNYKSDGKGVDEKINSAINEISDINYMGIDRGEKHLVYSCIIDKDSNIVKCEHYDEINKTNYVQKLDDVAKNRERQRRNWQQQDGIRDLKEGYISLVVHKLVDDLIKDRSGNINPHSYVVLEDLSTEMKRGRQKIEKQVYQNLETALARKLNYVVDKNADRGDIGSVSLALQLTPPLNNYDDIKNRKRFGVMLYTRANYTSITDPDTGWRQTIYLKDGNESDIKEQIMRKFTDFGFDGKDYFFEYIEDNAGRTWRLYSGKDGKSLSRFRIKKEKMEDFDVWVPESIDIVGLLDELFAKFDKTISFRQQIEKGVSLSKITNRKETAWQSLRFVIGLIQQIRNNGIEPDDDNFLQSPVRNADGVHFDTRNAANNGPLRAIVDADANGAYNIARKGLIMDAHIKYHHACGGKNASDINLLISDKEWDMWLLNRNKWEKLLPSFACKEKGRGKLSRK